MGRHPVLLGVFFNGMDPWAPAANSLDATNAAGLRGSATYSGGATGVYVDGDDSGLRDRCPVGTVA